METTATYLPRRVGLGACEFQGRRCGLLRVETSADDQFDLVLTPATMGELAALLDNGREALAAGALA